MTPSRWPSQAEHNGSLSVAHSVAERLGDDGGVVGERVGGVTQRPAALVLLRLRQVPVVERDEGGDALGEQLVDQPRVEVEALLVDRTGAAGDDPRPGDREPVGTGADVPDQLEILFPAVVVVARHVAVHTVVDRARHPAERVPDRRPAAIDVDSTLDLVRRRSDAPDEVCWERTRSLH
jgi:hypothetical protein